MTLMSVGKVRLAVVGQKQNEQVVAFVVIQE